MAKSTKPVASKPATPAKTPAKKPLKNANVATAKAAAKKPAKPAVAARPAKAVAEKKPVKPVTRSSARRKPEVSPEQRRSCVEIAAYFIAERHGFTPGREQEDWVAAEAEIDRMIAEGMLRT